MAMENIHSETYSLLIDQYLRNDEQEKARLFNAINTIPVVQKKANWAASWMNGVGRGSNRTATSLPRRTFWPIPPHKHGPTTGPT